MELEQKLEDGLVAVKVEIVPMSMAAAYGGG